MLNKKDLGNLEGLFMLSAIENFGGKRRTSEALGTSIDTINKYIDNLENNLGLKLLYSNDRGSKLTVDGLKVVKSTQKMREVLYEVYSLSCKSGEIKGEVRIAMNLGVRSSLKFTKFSNFYEKYPGLSVISVIIDGDPDMRNHSYDLGIMYEVPANSDLCLIYRKKILCGYFAAADYLAQYGYPKNKEDMMQNHRMLLKCQSLTMVEAWKEVARKALRKVYCSNSMFDLNDAVRNGMGIGIMPAYFAEDGLVCLDNIKCDNELYFNLVARHSTKNLPKNRVVINLYKELLEAM